MDINELKLLVHYAKKDKALFQKLTSDPKGTMENLGVIPSSLKKSKGPSASPNAAKCTLTCGPVTCGRTCGNVSCQSTCATSCRTNTCRRSCSGLSCGGSCPRTIGIIQRHMLPAKKAKR